jgi:hypothetical protein
MATKEVDLGMVRGDINDSVATFTQASTRSNINSGETGKTIFGKIKKYFADLGVAAFCAVVNNATTTTANTVLDGRMGKIFMDKIDELNRNSQSVTKYDEFVTSEYKITRLGSYKQFIYNGRVPHDWKAGIQFALNTSAYPEEYRPKTTFSVVATIAGNNTTAAIDFRSDGFIYIKPSALISADSWVTIHVMYF